MMWEFGAMAMLIFTGHANFHRGTMSTYYRLQGGAQKFIIVKVIHQLFLSVIGTTPSHYYNRL